MTKLLRQVFGVWTSDKPFDPQREARQTQTPPTDGTQTDVTATAETKTAASGLRDESQPTRGLDEEVTEANGTAADFCWDRRSVESREHRRGFFLRAASGK